MTKRGRLRKHKARARHARGEARAALAHRRPCPCRRSSRIQTRGPSMPVSRALHPQQKFLAPIAPANYLPRFDMADYDAEELQHLYAAAADDDDSAQPRARPSAGKSRCPKSCDSGIMLLPLPCASEVRISVSPSTPSRRRKFFLALAAGNVAPFPLLPSESTCRNTPALQRSPAI